MKLDNICGSIPDDRDIIYVPLKGPFPPRLDLKPEVFEIEDQLTVGSCTCNSSVSACEILKPNAYSRLFAYWQTRNVIENNPGAEGAQLRDAIRSHYHYGLPLESIWPYDVSKVNVQPDPVTYADALTRKVTRYERIDVDGIKALDPMGPKNPYTTLIATIQSALNEGLAVVVATRVGTEIQHLTGPWQSHKMHPAGPTNGNTWIGNHATLIVGYDNSCPTFGSGQPGSYLVQNSWGKSYGDGGFFGYNYSAFYMDVFEAWVIRGFDDVVVNPPQYVTPPMEILQVFRDLHYWDAMTIDDPAVLYWANDTRGKKFLIETMRDNFVDNANKMITSLP